MASIQFSQDDISHEADVSTPLHHGIIRYEPSESLPLAVRNALPAKNDRPFLFVPVGYLHREPKYMSKILAALELDLPNIIIVTGETSSEGTNCYEITQPSTHPVAREWSQEHTKEVLQAKVDLLLESVIESAMGVGAWLLPDSPRRRNASAQRICQTMAMVGKRTGCPAVSMGLIGLDENGEDPDLRQSLRDVMVPVGSPVRSVCKLIYDLELIDAAPCPQLSHVLVFQSPEEKNIFRRALLNTTPDLMLAFGDLTEEAMRNVFAHSGSPIILLKHTSPNVDKLVRMFKHVKRYIKEAPMIESNDESRCLSRVPPIEGEDDPLVRLFVHTWPPEFRSESVVLADPLITTPQRLQNRLLEALMACFGLKTGVSTTRQIKHNALNYAWSFYDVASRHATKKKDSAEILHVQLVIFTLLSIIAAVMYNQWYGGEGAPSNTTQMVFYVATILLPLYVTNLKQETDKGNALSRWGAFEVAAVRMRSEIFKLRAQVGPYRITNKSELAHQETIQCFSNKIREIWSSVQPSLQNDGIHIPEPFWDHLAEPDLNSLPQKRPTSTSSAPSRGHDVTTPRMSSKALSERSPLLLAAANLSHESNVGPNIPLPKPSIDSGDSSLKKTDDSDDEENPQDRPFVDNNYKPIKVDDYIQLRMQSEMNRKTEDVERMAARNATTSNTIKFITMFSGATAAVSLQWFVPIVLGMTAALSTGQEFRKYPRRIDLGNDLIVKLNKLKLWWMGLSMYEKQLPHHRDHLVLTAEKLIVNEVVSTYESGQQSKYEEEECRSFGQLKTDLAAPAKEKQDTPSLQKLLMTELKQPDPP